MFTKNISVLLAAVSGLGVGCSQPVDCDRSFDLFLSDNLAAIQDCAVVTGSVTAQRTRLVDFNKLENLEAIHGSLMITDNAQLVDLEGLKNLNYIGESLYI
jgi:hypothetical protein